jgi:hypothetical protein
VAGGSGARTPNWVGKLLVLLLVAIAITSALRGILHAVEHSEDFGITLKVLEVLAVENPYERYFLRDREWVADTALEPLNPNPPIPSQAPSAILLLWPYGLLPWPAAKLAWMLSNLFFTAGIITLGCRRLLPGRSVWLYAVLASLFVIGSPWRNVMTNGQHLLAGMFFFLLALELAERDRGLLAGFALAASFVKYSTTLLLLPYLVFRRQWMPIVVAFLLHGAMTLAAAWRLDENPFTLVLRSVRPAGMENGFDGFVDVFAVTHLLGLPAALAGAVSAALLLFALWLALSRRADDEFFLAALCILSTVLVYHRHYDLIILLLLLMIALKHRDRAPLAFALVSMCVALTWYVDRPIVFFTDWLRDRDNPFFYALVGVWYVTTCVLLYQAWPRASTRDDAAVASAL